MRKLTKTQIDRLGNRLRKRPVSDDDLKILDDYRKSYGEAYDQTVNLIKKQIRVGLAGRRAKSTSSIIEKLLRESIRLSQVQDIAGCRIILSDINEQDSAVSGLKKLFKKIDIVDRRIKPSFGYRAVHVIINVDGKLIEIQVRTILQHKWAELSEKLSDRLNPDIKYGGGPQNVQELLLDFSNDIKDYEDRLERGIDKFYTRKEKEPDVKDLIDKISKFKDDLNSQLDAIIKKVEKI